MTILGLGGRVFAQQTIGAPELGEGRRLLRIVISTTLLIQAVVAVALAPGFIVATSGAETTKGRNPEEFRPCLSG